MSNLPIIDLHTHVVPRAFLLGMAASAQRSRGAAPVENGVQVVERDGEMHWHTNGRLKKVERELYDTPTKIADMDRMGIDVSVVSVAPPTYLYDLEPEAGLRVSRLSNDGIAEMVSEYPRRLRGMATLPMQDPALAVKELYRVVESHGFKAVELGTSVESRTLAHPDFRPVLQAIADLDCFIFAHPNKCPQLPELEGYDLFNAIGFPLEEAIMGSRLMLNGTLDDIPTLRIVIAHGGGYLPYQIGRLAKAHAARESVRVDSATDPLGLVKRFYFDALTHHPSAVRMLIDLVGADRVVLGTDHPFDMGYSDPLGELSRVPGLSVGEREQVTRRTAAELLGELAE